MLSEFIMSRFRRTLSGLASYVPGNRRLDHQRCPVNGTRVTLVIDQLNSGGAQRQLCMLAVHLKRRGYHVEVLVYWRANFFTGLLREAGIPIVYVPSRNRLYLIYAMRRAVRRSRPDVVISFLSGSNMLAELAALPHRDFAVITSERNLDTSGRSLRRDLRYTLHCFADAVVSNSHSQRDRINQIAPYLEERTHVVVNGVDLDYFRPADPPGHSQSNEMRMVVLARYAPQKNPFGLLAAVEIIRREHPALNLVVDWYGAPIAVDSRRHSKWGYGSRQKLANYYRKLEEAIGKQCLWDRFRLHRTRQNVVPLYHAAEVVCLPSLYEGTSNVICEAMACGIPVLASRVSDNPRLVEEGRNGLLFDPLSPWDMADAIVRFAAEPLEVRRRMGLEGRKMAEAMLSPDVYADRFVELINQVILHRDKGGCT